MCDTLVEMSTQIKMFILFQNVTGSKHGGAISSFISWVASGSAHAVSLLPRASSPESPWFAYFVLEMEQELIEERTGLWREVLRELAFASGKANVDQAVKVNKWYNVNEAHNISNTICNHLYP